MLRAFRSQHYLRPATAYKPSVHRHFFTLPNLASLSPFPDSNEPQDNQTYHERKILPYVQAIISVTFLSTSPFAPLNSRYRSSDLYNLVADVESYPTFVPYCTGSRILERRTRENDVMVMDAELTVGFLSFKESYVSKVTCRPFESVEAIASSSTPLFKTLTTIWRFQPASAGSPHSSTGQLPPDRSHRPANRAISEHGGPTLVTLDLAFAFANPVHATISAAFFGKVSKLMVNAFEERCLAVLGPGSK
ncbi:hypothetical protein BV22DRAFT_1125241 [Leucogyrophana mollusca]|uniref:Uncharacterized protein n=1 Tax=Leucogyrophana mollusca TaxID=85980 RepID=A0ACB8BVT4_9AGAM|nr:hypothetical protein BV22DRAFT_1125241 [Leucogyrophana mollusca]